MVTFDAVVRILLSVVKRGRYEAFDRSPQCWSAVGHDLDRLTVAMGCRGEEPSCRTEIASRRDQHVDDLTELIHRPVDVTSLAGDLHIRLIDVPTIADHVATGHGRVGEEWREALHPPVGGDWVNVVPRSPISSYRRYHRTANTMISGGNRNPTNAELGTWETDGNDEASSRHTHRRPRPCANATVPPGTSAVTGNVGGVASTTW